MRICCDLFQEYWQFIFYFLFFKQRKLFSEGLYFKFNGSMFIILIKNNKMLARQPWKQEEDKILYDYLTCSQIDWANFKWSQLSQILRNKFTQWRRNGKQCRQRWTNHLNPALVNKNPTHNLDIQLYLNCIREHGRKWSVLTKFFPGRSQNQLKNFFYSSLKKGIKNLNLYNSFIKKKKKTLSVRFKYNIVEKALCINDEKKSMNVQVYAEKAYNLSESINYIKIEIIQGLISFSQHSNLTIQETNEPYQSLLKDVISFSSMCRLKGAKKFQQIRKEREDRSFCTILNVKQKRRKSNCIKREEKQGILELESENKKEQGSPIQGQINQDRLQLQGMERQKEVLRVQESHIFDVLNLQRRN